MIKQPFEGVKIVDFGWVGVGPLASEVLANMGATVVRVESPSRPDPLRMAPPFKDGEMGLNRSGFFTQNNANKFGVSLDLNKPNAKVILERLIKWTDAVTSGFSPGAMEKWGLSYEELRAIKEDIIVMATCMQGQTGPHRKFRGFGNVMAAVSGFYYITGWPDGNPGELFGAYTDIPNFFYTAVSLMAAIDYHRRTGEGQYIDQSQFEGSLQLLAPEILDWTANSRITERRGNRDSIAVPHGTFPCQGTDRWVAITVFSDEEWSAFCEVIGSPDWTNDANFSTPDLRRINEDELEKRVSEWTCNFTPQEVMKKMQEKGVAAGVVQTAEELLSDPQLKEREHFVPLKHTEMGEHMYQASPFLLNKTPNAFNRAAPCLGEHNQYVFGELLGFTDDDMADLIADGTIEYE